MDIETRVGQSDSLFQRYKRKGFFYKKSTKPRGISHRISDVPFKFQYVSLKCKRPDLSCDILKKLEGQLEESFADEKSVRDPLTGLHTQLCWNRDLAELKHGSTSSVGDGNFISAIKIEIKGLEKISARSGQVRADSILQRIARIMADNFESSGTVYRIGCNEFGVILPGFNEKEVTVLVDLLKIRLAKQRFPIGVELKMKKV